MPHVADPDSSSTSTAVQDNNSNPNTEKGFYSTPSLKTIAELLKLAVSVAPMHDIPEKESRAALVDGAKRSGDGSVNLYTHYYDHDREACCHVYVFGYVQFLHYLIRRMTPHRGRIYEDNVDGDFGIFMVDRDTFFINVVLNCQITKLHPIKITQTGAVILYSMDEWPPVRCYSSWEHLFYSLRDMLIRPLFIEIPYKLPRAETDGM